NKVFNNNIDKNDVEDDKVLKRLRTIKSAKIIADESVENIEKQINSPNTSFSNNKSLDESKNENNIIKDLKIENSTEIDKPKTSKTINNGNNTNNINKNLKTKQKSELSNIIGNEDDQFVDLDSLNVTESNFPDNFTDSNNSKSTVDKIANVMILVFSEINSIMGVDKKIYGPFKPQDIVVLPDINAEILVKNKMGRMVKS
ncbi:DNA replication complex subunit Gins51, partial [Methanobrevibacter sp.]|uniref:DNA replication complex subunit Gins51 n=1 Tax=Methanobrevibacter sp. TaxID=66852 RepID=UPI003FA5FEC6